ncbi:MAG: MarR family transcriptional regulator [Pseudomonadota bacterium]
MNFTTGRMNALCQQLLDPYDLSLPQWVILSCLWRDGPLTVGTLADLVGTGVPAASRIVDRMVERDLVARQRHRTDGRAMVVIPTERGQALDHLADFHERVNAVLFDGLTAEECEQAFDLLRRMQANAEGALR